MRASLGRGGIDMGTIGQGFGGRRGPALAQIEQPAGTVACDWRGLGHPSRAGDALVSQSKFHIARARPDVLHSARTRTNVVRAACHRGGDYGRGSRQGKSCPAPAGPAATSSGYHAHRRGIRCRPDAAPERRRSISSRPEVYAFAFSRCYGCSKGLSGLIRFRFLAGGQIAAPPTRFADRPWPRRRRSCTLAAPGTGRAVLGLAAFPLPDGARSSAQGTCALGARAIVGAIAARRGTRMTAGEAGAGVAVGERSSATDPRGRALNGGRR